MTDDLIQGFKYADDRLPVMRLALGGLAVGTIAAEFVLDLSSETLEPCR